MCGMWSAQIAMRHELTVLQGGRASAVREKDRLDIHCAVQDVKDGDPVSADAIEDQVSAVHPAADSVMFVTGHHRPSLRHVGNVEAELGELAHKAQRPHRVVLGDKVADCFKIRLGLDCDEGLHALGWPEPSYFRSRRATTSISGLARPASSSSMPRTNA